MEKSIDIEYLLKGHLAGTLSDREKLTLFSSLKDRQKLAGWNELVAELYEQAVAGSNYNTEGSENLEDMIQYILNHVPEKGETSSNMASVPAHRIHFLKTSWFRYAAAVILMLGAGIYVWFARQREEIVTTNGSKRQQTDIAPGSSKAVLTLADGSTMVLDNAQNGDLVQQGNAKVVKLATGQLAYKMGNVSVSKEVLYNTISTPRGGQYQIVLPDGSKVWLNAASSIKFPTVFTGNSRSIEMIGEAYMEIAKNSRQPFTVKSNGTEILVLGTSFNVNAYSNEGRMTTTLVEGAIQVVKGKEQLALKPGQQAVTVPGVDFIRFMPEADIDKVMAWKNGLFNLQDASLQEISRQLERWYDVEVKFEGNLPDKKFQGEIDRGIRLSAVLNWFSKLGIHSRLEGRTVILSAD